jgi:hypothetical protein
MFSLTLFDEAGTGAPCRPTMFDSTKFCNEALVFVGQDTVSLCWTYHLSVNRSDHGAHLSLSLKHAKELESHVLGQVPRRPARQNCEWPDRSSGFDVPQHLAVAGDVRVHHKLLVPTTRDTLGYRRHSTGLQLKNDRRPVVH